MTDHDAKVKENLWTYAKTFIERKKIILPAFDKQSCFIYFRKAFKVVNPLKNFKIPSWIPSLPVPENPFSDSPPSYQKVTRIIRKMKSSSSPCPLDQISIICFKRCPYLRSYVASLISVLWKTGIIPEEWKKSASILIHKKGPSNEPGNFWPITLESVPLKIFTACIRDTIFDFIM